MCPFLLLHDLNAANELQMDIFYDAVAVYAFTARNGDLMCDFRSRQNSEWRTIKF